MPAIAHVAISFVLLAFLAKVSKGELNYRHAIIFSVNSWFGPDIFGWMPYYGDGAKLYMFIHGIGWPIIALAVAIPWFFVNNSKLTWKPFKIDKRLKDDKYYLPYLQVFCLVAGGGLFHQFVDIIGHPSYVYHPGAGEVVPWGVVWMLSGDNYFTYDWILGTGYFPCGNYYEFAEFYVFFGIAAPLLFLFGFFVIPRKEGKGLLPLSILFFLAYTLVLGSAYLIPSLDGPWVLTGGEADFGIMVYFGIFFFIPMTLLYWGYNGFPSRKLEQNVST